MGPTSLYPHILMICMFQVFREARPRTSTDIERPPTYADQHAPGIPTHMHGKPLVRESMDSGSKTRGMDLLTIVYAAMHSWDMRPDAVLWLCASDTCIHVCVCIYLYIHVYAYHHRHHTYSCLSSRTKS
jgi:hypothetical protein